MKRTGILFVLALLSATVAAPRVDAVVDNKRSTAQLVRGMKHEPDELLVKWRSAVGVSRAQALTVTHEATSVREFGRSQRLRGGPIDQWRVVKFPAGTELARRRAALLRDPAVERVEYNYEVRIQRVPNDPSFGQLWGLHNIGQTGGKTDADIDAPEAWDQSTGDPNVVVAVIDTGVAYTHPDLAANMWVNPGEIPGNGIDDDGNGFVDDVHGYDFANDDGDPFDDHGHGTHVAGTIAAVGNNGIGVTGVNWNARIMAVKFLAANGSGTTANAIKAILYAASMGAKVLNNSWAGGAFSDALLDAIRTADQAGALFIAAAGNSGISNDITPNFPSNYVVPNVVAVAATDQNDALAIFSNIGGKTVHLGAPGVSILSTVPSTGAACCANATGYAALDGTSMATPHVSGAAALLFSRFPEITHRQVRQRLLANTDPLPALATATITGGRLNVAKAMEVDDVPPAAVLDLAPADIRARTLMFNWRATGDDNHTGTASLYDLRYSLTPINEENFDLATVVTDTLKASPAGTLESFMVRGLKPDTDYFFALRVQDNVGNFSPVSNVAAVRTRPLAIMFQDNMESGAASRWAIAGTNGENGPALWHLSTHRASSPTTAFYYGKEDTLNYDTGTINSGSITSNPINLTGQVDSFLTFRHYLDVENLAFFDTARVEVSTNNGATWADAFVTSFSTGGMVTQEVDLARYDGSVILLRFSFDTRDAQFNNLEGWVVDDVIVSTTLFDNERPIASAGGPYSGFRNQAIRFDGTASRSPDGKPLTYAWNFGDSSTGSGPTPTHAYRRSGTYTVTLVVNDGTNASAPASATVSVSNRAPVANAGGPYSGQQNQAITFNGSGTDADGDALTFTWNFGDGATGSGATATHAYGAAGTYTATLIANDGEVSSAASTATVTIQGGGEPPHANAGPDRSVRRGTRVFLSGTASSDPDGSIVSYRWQQVSGPTVTLRNANTAVADFRAPNQTGPLTFRLTVTDNSGSTATDQVTITVTR